MLPSLEKIWESRILTNNGPFHEQFEMALRLHLRVPEVSLFNNCAIALLVALKALKVTGEVITTPYSFVATTHALLWCNLKPIFVDIDPKTMNIDPSKIQAAITPQTTAILAVHCYGNPCDTSSIARIAETNGLKVIYDAAHAFGVEDAEKSLLNNGDISAVGFHATKVFNTFEGGALVCRDTEVKRRVDLLKNFGFSDEISIEEVGLNGKMSEFSAALGLQQLRHMRAILARREEIDRRYRAHLGSIDGLTCPPRDQTIKSNYSYFPILVDKAPCVNRDILFFKLREAGIYSRRYFYPLISNLPMYRGLPSASIDKLPIASDIASRVLCLPIYPDLIDEKVDEICAVITDIMKGRDVKLRD